MNESAPDLARGSSKHLVAELVDGHVPTIFLPTRRLNELHLGISGGDRHGRVRAPEAPLAHGEPRL